MMDRTAVPRKGNSPPPLGLSRLDADWEEAGASRPFPNQHLTATRAVVVQGTLSGILPAPAIVGGGPPGPHMFHAFFGGMAVHPEDVGLIAVHGPEVIEEIA